MLATPNGWDMREQATLRKAAIRASLVTEENEWQLLQFVTETSVHYALDDQHDKWLRKDTVFAVIDCGGSTVDTTVYKCMSTAPLRLQEACPSECVQVFQPFSSIHQLNPCDDV
jgi:sorbitol-specific phosphotransferase system component IIBC